MKEQSILKLEYECFFNLSFMPPDFYQTQLFRVLLPLLPFITGLIRFKKMDPAYHSLVYIFGAAALAECTRFILLYHYYTRNQEDIFRSYIGYNLYVLAIGLLYTHLFFKWGLFEKRVWAFRLLMMALPLVWVLEHFVVKGNQLHAQTIVYRLFYAFLLCLYAIQQINLLLVTERGSLLRNTSFMVCFCILFFFLPYIISEGIFLFNPKVSLPFGEAVFLFRTGAYQIFVYRKKWNFG
jgi:hypothetical protein